MNSQFNLKNKSGSIPECHVVSVLSGRWRSKTLTLTLEMRFEKSSWTWNRALSDLCLSQSSSPILLKKHRNTSYQNVNMPTIQRRVSLTHTHHAYDHTHLRHTPLQNIKINISKERSVEIWHMTSAGRFLIKCCKHQTCRDWIVMREQLGSRGDLQGSKVTRRRTCWGGAWANLGDSETHGRTPRTETRCRSPWTQTITERLKLTLIND